jgi:hypothetical protein
MKCTTPRAATRRRRTTFVGSYIGGWKIRSYGDLTIDDYLATACSLRLFVVAFVGACERIDALTRERDEVREQLQKIGRKAFWLEKELR